MINIFKKAWSWIVIFYQTAVFLRDRNTEARLRSARELDDTNPDLKTRIDHEATTEPGAHAVGDVRHVGREDSV